MPTYEDELVALRAMIGNAAIGDVIGVTALGMRPEIFAWLDDHGGATAGTRGRPTDREAGQIVEDEGRHAHVAPPEPVVRPVPRAAL